MPAYFTTSRTDAFESENFAFSGHSSSPCYGGACVRGFYSFSSFDMQRIKCRYVGQTDELAAGVARFPCNPVFSLAFFSIAV